jgi:hypothetical protein
MDRRGSLLDSRSRVMRPTCPDRGPLRVAALEAFLDARGIVLDAIARLELLDIALADVAARYEGARVH